MRRIQMALSLLFHVIIFTDAAYAAAVEDNRTSVALQPPRGWNSYDSFSWILREEEFMENARLVAKYLLEYGYEYVVVDFLWYREAAPGVTVSTGGHDLIDHWGRPIPDPNRWPSSANGKGFRPIADMVHAMGLKFGIHVMRGISTSAVLSNTPILGVNTSWRADDIIVQDGECSWMPACFIGINCSTVGGQAFVKSLYQQYADWGVDFVKHDCVFGEKDLQLQEIEAVTQAILNTTRPMVHSVSPGLQTTLLMAQSVCNITNMYRVADDVWDTWEDIEKMFDIASDFAHAKLLGSDSLNGKSWPDLDALPFGTITEPGSSLGPNRKTKLTWNEQRSQTC